MSEYPALGVKSPDVMGTLNDILGLQSKKLQLQQQAQNLQTGLATQQTAQQGAAQGGIDLAERQKVATYLSLPGNKGKKAADMADDIHALAPTTGENYLSKIRDGEKTQTALSQAVTDLGQDQKQILAGVASSFVGSDAPNAEIERQIDAAVEQNPGLAGAAHWSKKLLDHAADPSTAQNPQAATALKKARDQQLAQFGYSVTGKSPLVGGQADVGPAITGTQQSAVTGGLAPVGGTIVKGLAPTEQPAYKRAVGAAGTEGTQGAANDEALYNDITKAASKASTIRSQAKDIQALADGLQTGEWTKGAASKLSTLKQLFGIQSTADDFDTRRQLLGKMTQQLMLQREQAHGASTDAAQAHVEAAMPSPDSMNPAAIREAARYVAAQAAMDQARANVASKHRSQTGSSTGLRAVDQGFMSDQDVKTYQYEDLPKGEERQQFLRRHFVDSGGKLDKAALQAFKDRADRAQYHGAP